MQCHQPCQRTEDPDEVVIGVYSDSVLFMYSEGRSRSGANAIYLWSQRWPNYWMARTAVVGGQTPTQGCNSLPTDPEAIAREDVTMVVCTLSEVRESMIASFLESSTAGTDIINLCRMMTNSIGPCWRLGAPMSSGATATPRGARRSRRWCELVVEWISRPSAARAI